jgi:ribosome-interacting GTPase 1
MPANLPPDYFAAEKRYRQTTDIQEKIRILREMLAIMPKHKGTEHLQGDLKRKIAKLQSQAKKKHATSRSSNLDHIQREGAGQVALVGPPNSGKSSILTHMTHAHSTVAEYPFSTFKPVQGMMSFEDVQVQLVDIPPVSTDYSESWIFNIIRLVDLVLLTADLSDKACVCKTTETLGILKDHRIRLETSGEKTPQGPDAIKSTIMIGTKRDHTDAEEHESAIIENFPQFTLISVSIEGQINIPEFKREIFKGLRIIRVYTKIPGKKADHSAPYVLPVGSTVQEAATMIHKEVGEMMTYARLWGQDAYAGQRIERDHILKDGDVLEVHTR